MRPILPSTTGTPLRTDTPVCCGYTDCSLTEPELGLAQAPLTDPVRFEVARVAQEGADQSPKSSVTRVRTKVFTYAHHTAP